MRAWREKLAVTNMTLAKRIAVAVWRTLSHEADLDDIISAAYVGLVKAAEKYNRKAGPFPQYASIRIRGAIYDYLREIDPLGRRGRQAQRGGKILPLTLKVSLDDIPHILQTARDPSPEDTALEAERARLVRKAIRLLSVTERKIMQLVYTDGFTLTRAAEILGCTEGWVSVLHGRVIERLKEMLCSSRE